MILFKRKLIKKLKDAYGKEPVTTYFDGDMNWIRTTCDDRREEEPERFYVDDTTWNDLNMDAVYKRINACCSTAGEQRLYTMLRRPMNREEFEHERGLITMMEQEPEKRLKLQVLLSRLGVNRAIYLKNILKPKERSNSWLIIYCLLSLFLPVSIVCFALIGKPVLWMPLLAFMVNGTLHGIRQKSCETEMRTANYCISLALTLERIRRMKDEKLDRYLEKAYGHLKPLKSLIRGGGIATDPVPGSVKEMFMTLLLWDLIYFEIVKVKLAKYHDDFRVIHEAVGGLDAAISIASYRASTEGYCVPEIDYDAEKPFIHAEEIVHPLLKQAVPNELALDKSMLITGSNASGKSTYLRASILNALFAQTICTCTCKNYKGSPFRIYTSMALTDDVLSGDSYYIAEIKSLKRILDDRSEGEFVLCAIDEVLRGTNTIERIAASAEVLNALDQERVLCLIATHDLELCDMASEGYTRAHFEEKISDDDILFDYKLKPGPAVSRNAIHLLKLIGFDEGIVKAAHARADKYVETGKWQ